MKPRSVVRASVTAFAGLAFLFGAGTAYSQVEARRLAAMNAARQLEGRYERFVNVTSRYGLAAANPSSKRVGVTILPSAVTGTSTEAMAGFLLPPFGVDGMSMPGGGVTASVNVLDVRGVAKVHLDVRDVTAGRDVAFVGQDVTAPGRVTLRTAPGFTLADGSKYRARVLVWIGPGKSVGGLVTGCVATIDQIQWVFEP